VRKGGKEIAGNFYEAFTPWAAISLKIFNRIQGVRDLPPHPVLYR
jgi:hypothetical protein